MVASGLHLEQLYNVPGKSIKNVSLDRMLTIPASALGTLRKELTETIGIERAKGFLLRYGWHCGISDAEKIKKMDWDNQKELLRAGPKLHILHGYLEETQEVTVEVDFSAQTINHEAIWKSSYEAEEYLKVFGKSDHPVCHTLVGYASGYLTTILGKKVIAKEVECMAMGHKHCHAVCHTIEEWDGELDEELKYYESNSIIDELDNTFKKLKAERDNLSKFYEAHHILTKEVLRESNLSSIAKALYKISELPVFIVNEEMNPLAYAGAAEQDRICFTDNLKKMQSSLRGVGEIHKSTNLELSHDMHTLITPIYLNKKIVGYCCFLYRDQVPQEVDQLFLEQGSMACSLYLMNERTRIMTEQRIQGNLLDDLLANRISEEEIRKKAFYIEFQLEGPYFMIGLSKPKESLEGTDDYGALHELTSDISLFLNDRKINALLGEKRGHIVILLTEGLQLTSTKNKEAFCQSLINFCARKYPDYQLKAGISSSTERIEEAAQLFDEGLSALKAANERRKVVFYDSLGIEGVMYHMKNVKPIEKFIKKKLGNLIKEDRLKDMELTRTLYCYLSNGSNLYKTARTMSLSISGLRYRLRKINEILETDINNPKVGYQIFLALQFFIYWGGIDLEVDVDLNIDGY
ncbi:XylR N-terminal domain-containing protein [Niallia oryzisoli]|uniref:XylR N-terminal domain-containing protein n=1 Tax=Niallia oryzisoli TaxID=1737571 RepID=UPI003736A247